MEHGLPWDPSAHEELVHAVSGVDRFRGPRWVRGFRAVSAQIQDREARAASTGAHSASAGVDDAVILRALVFAQRTRTVLAGLTRPRDYAGRRIVDVGAGTGAVALTALDHGASEVISLEISRPERAWMLRAREHLSDPRWRIDARPVIDPQLAIPGDLWIFGFSLHELTAGDPQRGAELLSAVIEQGARVLVVEPGTRPSARHLQRVRDCLPHRVLRPCRGAAACPRLADDRAWCHFTWRARFGPEMTALLQSAGRQANHVHFSYLELGRAAGSTERGARLLEVRRMGRRRAELRLCTAEGERVVEVSTHDRQVRNWADQLKAGAVLELPVSSRRPSGTLPVLEPPCST